METPPSTTAPPKAGARKRPASPAGKQPKESRGEEILHELFRLAKVDLRASKHGQSLARELSGLIGGKN